MHHACWFCKPIIAILLQRNRLIARMHHACWLCFVNPPCNIVTKKTSDDHQHLLVVFCKPVLAIVVTKKASDCSHTSEIVNSSHQVMLPKRRFLTVEQAVWRAFSKHFSTNSSPNPVLTPFKMLPVCGDTTDLLFCLPKSSFREHASVGCGTKVSIDWVLTLGERFPKSFKSFCI